ALRPGAWASTRTMLVSRMTGIPVWKTAVPHGSGSVRSATASSTAQRWAAMRRRSASVSVLVAAGAADHDLVLLDRDLDRAVAGPVLGVDGIVLHGGIEPQAVAPLRTGDSGLQR